MPYNSWHYQILSTGRTSRGLLFCCHNSMFLHAKPRAVKLEEFLEETEDSFETLGKSS